MQKLNANDYAVLTDNSVDSGLRKVIVTVMDPSGRTTLLETFRSRPAGTLQPLGVDQTVVKWVGVELQVGASGTPVSSGTLLTNHAEDQTP
ncbi:MAG: hypothetical protein R3B90_20680 [Planctomycetaceae bacterium]